MPASIYIHTVHMYTCIPYPLVVKHAIVTLEGKGLCTGQRYDKI